MEQQHDEHDAPSTAQQQEAPAAAPEAEAKAEAPKKRRGRPPKAQAAQQAGEAAQEKPADGKSSPAPAERADATPAEQAETAVPADEGAAGAASADAGSEPVTPKKRTYTRRRKHSAASAEQAEQSEQAEAAAEAKQTAADHPAGQSAEEPAGEAAAPAPEPAAEEPAESAPADAGAADAHGQAAEAAEPAESTAEGAGTSKSAKRRRNRRNRNGKQRREIVPSATRDELAMLADDELVAKALSLDVEAAEYGERDDLVSAVYDALLQSEGFVMVEGILDLLPDGYGFIRTDGYLPGEHDVYVGMSLVRRNGLRKGDYVTGRVRPPRDNEKYPALNTIVSLNDEPFEGPTHRVKFANLTPIYPDERLVMEHGKDTYTARAIDLVSPIGKGQRGLIVSPPKAGKTTVLKDIAAAISANNPEVHLMCLLVDERPEEVTDMERSIDGEVISSTFDMPSENHIAVAELVIERAKRLVENGQDVVILLDSITRLARAYNLSQPASGRILSGGVDSTALYPPKRFLGAARNIEFGGSLTILGTALIDTGSKMDEVIFEEFKGTGNMELRLDRNLADRRVFPAIDPVASSTRKDELLLDSQEAPLVWGLRRLLANMNNTERAMKMLIQSLRQTETNQEFLIKSARKANKAVDL